MPSQKALYGAQNKSVRIGILVANDNLSSGERRRRGILG
ncbi:hypothetical protein SAMN05421780_103178 [Flexibacter flexilis DSM 6793]|uniref:Uncharacterized protein n=1 Tax=Flexibacter flexilis DSM 6793 TaxID=927664 RepID=A0A1I1H2I7_9BACT|nr:hypothetical protein SAMN05421780_103178 [Flexibacter flexilis DSM 6793]